MATRTYTACAFQNIDCILPMQDYSGAFPAYPVTVFNVSGQAASLVQANNENDFCDIWNSDPSNQAAGVIEIGPDAHHFGFRSADLSITAPPAVRGMRHFQFDQGGAALYGLFGSAETRFSIDGGAPQRLGTAGAAVTDFLGVPLPFTGAYASLPNSIVGNTIRVYFNDSDAMIGIASQSPSTANFSGRLPAAAQGLYLFHADPEASNFKLTGSPDFAAFARALLYLYVETYAPTPWSSNVFQFSSSDNLRRAALHNYSGQLEATGLTKRANYSALRYLVATNIFDAARSVPSFTQAASYTEGLVLNGNLIQTSAEKDQIYIDMAAVFQASGAIVASGAVISTAGGPSAVSSASQAARTYLSGIGFTLFP